MVAVRLPPALSTLSSAAVTVTSCPVAQSAAGKVRVSGETVTMAASELASATVTSAVGRLASASL